jgi:hypothetical protein
MARLTNGFKIGIGSPKNLTESSLTIHNGLKLSSFAIGTQVELVFHTQFVTFTAEQFDRALKSKNYIEVRQQVLDPQGRPVSLQAFSKGDTTVFLPPVSPPAPVVFRIINTVNLESRYKEVKEMLIAMNIYPNIVSLASFTCTTRTKAKSKPLERLTSLVNKTFVAKISKNLEATMKVSSIRLGTSFPMKQEVGYEISIEPLMTNAEEEYFISIVYTTHKMDDFDKLISQFGSDLIQRIIEEETTKNV